MSAPTNTELAVLLRETQWLLDEVANDVVRNGVSVAKAAEVANVLENLAKLVRKPTPLVLDGETTP